MLARDLSAFIGKIIPASTFRESYKYLLWVVPGGIKIEFLASVLEPPGRVLRFRDETIFREDASDVLWDGLGFLAGLGLPKSITFKINLSDEESMAFPCLCRL